MIIVTNYHNINDLLVAWFIAALLPLPRRPTAGDLPEADAAPDLEKTLCMMDEARYENARWWRNLNRLMCIIGVLIIIAIVKITTRQSFGVFRADSLQIALAIVATRMRN